MSLELAMIPAGDEDTASSRLRVHSVARWINASKVGRAHVVTTQAPARVNAVFVQKRVTVEILQYATRMKQAGAAVLYDIDDLGPALDYWAEPRLVEAMIRTCDALTTDTEAHRVLLARRSHGKPVAVFPDGIDYDPPGPVAATPCDRERLRVLWFGSASNLWMFAPYASGLHASGRAQIVVVTGANSIPTLRANNPFIEFLPWSRADFPAALQSCDLACLMHDGTEEDRAKSNNKMIASIGWGVPALVSATPEYAATAAQAGVEGAVFSNPAELLTVIERYRSTDARAAYLRSAQPAVWKNYGPDAIVRHFVSALELALRSRVRELEASRPSAVK